MLESKFELKEVKIYIFCFLCVFYMQVITLLATQPLAFVSGQE